MCHERSANSENATRGIDRTVTEHPHKRESNTQADSYRDSYWIGVDGREVVSVRSI
jgi:hypothetical protein